MAGDLDTSKIKDWRSIITLVLFVITNIIVLFPFKVPIYIPRVLYNATLDMLSSLRIITSRKLSPSTRAGTRWFVRFQFPVNFVTAPLATDLFLLAILAIGRKEVHDGTLGSDNIQPIDIMAFFLTLAYIAISIDASGLIRWLAFKVLLRAGGVGHWLFFYLYAFFFALGSFIGNDPIILSGTAFLAYMTRVSSNIAHPRAWIHSQFAIANIASAILVSSNPTNLVLAGAFNITFIKYTANMIVPVVVTAIVVFPFLLYLIFTDKALIPYSIEMHELPDDMKNKPPVNPNIPHARGEAEIEETRDESVQLLSLEEIMNPFLDKKGAAFGALIMAATLITVLALNAVTSSSSGETHPVYWVTLPGAFVMFCWDLASGWTHRHETREIAAKGRREMELARINKERSQSSQDIATENEKISGSKEQNSPILQESMLQTASTNSSADTYSSSTKLDRAADARAIHTDQANLPANRDPHIEPFVRVEECAPRKSVLTDASVAVETAPGIVGDLEKTNTPDGQETSGPRTLVSLSQDFYHWLQLTFPTVTVVVSHMPFPLVPFAFSMFVLVQALVTKGWVPVFAYGWDHWVEKTGTVGAVGGMGFLSVILCNFAGTNIGTTILLSRVIQAWQQIHRQNGLPISDRTFWATVYSMAIGVNYGAFSTAFSASLAGLLWRDILRRKFIRVGSIEFATVNLPIIAISMVVGCTVLVGQIYITRKDTPYDS
ncbi:Uncharacterized protein PECH_003211 [Penicillium ucsense]|uniref:Citrate transporter-like domain-containing protein n=1 Tax=Penicillium ucsense TaxID=2839758 RepID=A0A8J8W4X5_9EURO|nr:Uncharacterized protein PECM_004849 [Penicillium ucsense]KAF7737717.1 Uncharacterized protein PECH_003211 [Penicillium ucsense]